MTMDSKFLAAFRELCCSHGYLISRLKGRVLLARSGLGDLQVALERGQRVFSVNYEVCGNVDVVAASEKEAEDLVDQSLVRHFADQGLYDLSETEVFADITDEFK